MSSSTVMDSFDAPMLDYPGDMDVHMQTTLSSPKPWIQPETIMEEDVHPIQLPNPFPSHLPQQDVEIDMDDYYNENVEYEMADGEIAAADTELVDIDVYDATREEAALASASISHPTGPTDQDISKKPTSDRHLPSESGVSTTDHIPPISNLQPPLRQSAEAELLTPTPLHATVGQDHDTKPSDPSDVAVALQENAPPLGADTKGPHSSGEASTALERHTGSPRVATADGTSDNVTVLPLDDSERKREPEFSPAEHESSASVPQNVTPGAAGRQAEIQDSESHDGVRILDESYEGGVPGAALDSAEAGEAKRPATKSRETEEDDADPHEIFEGVYIEPPPPVLIELPLTSNQPVCSLFNALSNLPSADTGVNFPNAEASCTILFQTRPTLYYETLNDFFDALREEERIQSITEFADGEMVIDAYDLQLAISEVIAALFSSFDAVLTVSKRIMCMRVKYRCMI
jgi:hypothetical protein